jgi:hypothetical protein
MVSTRPLIILCANLMLGMASAIASPAFLTEMEDLPLAPGLTEVPGGMLFEQPTGRIVEASASGDMDATQIISFYAQTLPELGWEKIAATTFRRDNEILRIDMEPRRRPLVVRFSVVPN